MDTTKPKSLLNDESAVSYGLFVIATVLVLGTLLYVCIIEVTQQSNDIMNEFITAGSVTQKTRDVYNNQLALITAAPIFMLIGVFLWGIVRSVEKKRTEG
jgi:hypothetical protein